MLEVASICELHSGVISILQASVNDETSKCSAYRISLCLWMYKNFLSSYKSVNLFFSV